MTLISVKTVRPLDNYSTLWINPEQISQLLIALNQSELHMSNGEIYIISIETVNNILDMCGNKET